MTRVNNKTERDYELLRSAPAIGLSRSSQMATPSQAHILLKFWKIPADRAIIPQAILRGNFSKLVHFKLLKYKKKVFHLSPELPLIND